MERCRERGGRGEIGEIGEGGDLRGWREWRLERYCTRRGSQAGGRASFGSSPAVICGIRGESRADGGGALGVGVVVTAEDVGEENKFHHPEENHQLDDDERPQLASYGHGAEAVDIEVEDAAHGAVGSDVVGRHDGDDVGRIVDDVVGVVIAQLAHGSESPGDAYRLDAGAAGGLHVHAGVAHI